MLKFAEGRASPAREKPWFAAAAPPSAPMFGASAERKPRGGLGLVLLGPQPRRFFEMENINQMTTAKPQPRGMPRKRDQQVRRFIARIRTLAPHCDNPVFAGSLAAFARVAFLLERSYLFIRDKDVIGENGELRPSVDTVRRLAETHSRLAKELGLTPVTLRALSREKVVDPLDGD